MKHQTKYKLIGNVLFFQSTHTNSRKKNLDELVKSRDGVAGTPTP